MLVLIAPSIAGSSSAAGEPVAAPSSIVLTRRDPDPGPIVLTHPFTEPTFLLIQPNPFAPNVTLALGVSGDGRAVVGSYIDGSLGSVGYRWTYWSRFMTTFVSATPSLGAAASAASFDGTVVVGGDDTEAHYWTTATGSVPIGVLPGGAEKTFAWDVSADGAVIVGQAENANGTEAFRWTPATGMVGLGDLPGGTFYSVARGVSADGSVVVGTSISAAGREPFMWTASTGMVGLGHPSGGYETRAFGISADGLVAVGGSRIFGSGDRAFRWTAETGMVVLEASWSASQGSSAVAVSGDGSVVVGQLIRSSLDPDVVEGSFIWDAQHGMRNFDTALTQAGITPTVPVREVRGISDDGTVIVGIAEEPGGLEVHGFAAAIPVPEPSLALLQACALALLGIVRRASRT